MGKLMVRNYVCSKSDEKLLAFLPECFLQAVVSLRKVKCTNSLFYCAVLSGISVHPVSLVVLFVVMLDAVSFSRERNSFSDFSVRFTLSNSGRQVLGGVKIFITPSTCCRTNSITTSSLIFVGAH